MTQRVVYKITNEDEMWSISLHGEFLAGFMRRERAVRFADLLAQRNFRRDGLPAVVRVCEKGGQVTDVVRHGERDPAANALAWVRHVKALREARRKEAKPPLPSGSLPERRSA